MRIKRAKPNSLGWLLACSLLVGLTALLSACSGGNDSDSAGDQGLGATDPTDHTATTMSTSSPSVLGTTEALPRTIYVNPAASGGDGSQGAPLASAALAIGQAKPGDTIVLQAGSHPKIEVTGFQATSNKPLRIEAQPGAVVSAGGFSGAGIQITNSSYVWITGVTVTNSLWGINVNASNNVHIERVSISDMGQEGIIIHGDSSFVFVDRSDITRTGVRPGVGQFGEGIYVGTGSDPASDRTNNVSITNNTITFTSAEAIDIKSYTHDILIDSNTIHDVDTHNSGALVVGVGDYDYPDPNVIISNNVIYKVRSNPSPYRDANCILISAPATLINNVISDCSDRGIFIDRFMPDPLQRDVKLWHNTVYSKGWIGDIVTEGVANIDARNNIGLDQQWNVASSADLFTDPNGPVLALDLTSANLAVDSGTPIDGVSKDRVGSSRQQGSAPDLGAYETPGTPSTGPSTPAATPRSVTPIQSTPTTATAAPTSSTSVEVNRLAISSTSAATAQTEPESAMGVVSTTAAPQSATPSTTAAPRSATPSTSAAPQSATPSTTAAPQSATTPTTAAASTSTSDLWEFASPTLDWPEALSRTPSTTTPPSGGRDLASDNEPAPDQLAYVEHDGEPANRNGWQLAILTLAGLVVAGTAGSVFRARFPSKR